MKYIRYFINDIEVNETTTHDLLLVHCIANSINALCLIAILN